MDRELSPTTGHSVFLVGLVAALGGVTHRPGNTPTVASLSQDGRFRRAQQ